MHRGIRSGRSSCCRGQSGAAQDPASHLGQTATLLGSCASRHAPLSRASHLPVLRKNAQRLFQVGLFKSLEFTSA